MSKYLGKVCLDIGSTTECSINFISNPNTGIFGGSGNINICNSGTTNLQISSTLITLFLPIVTTAGTLSAPSIQFNSASNGIYLSGTNTVSHVIAGSALLTINSSGLQVSGTFSNSGNAMT